MLISHFIDAATSEEFWVSGVKQRGSNAQDRGVQPIVDEDAREEFDRLRSGD